ncbi:MAG: superoxide dismutase family protein, partial [Candidatus Eremiobacteraeota bacterium]|nr:superoxide dismutase family protein [Candidatus Eremiobacteraeota bacterium]
AAPAAAQPATPPPTPAMIAVSKPQAAPAGVPVIDLSRSADGRP